MFISWWVYLSILTFYWVCLRSVDYWWVSKIKGGLMLKDLYLVLEYSPSSQFWTYLPRAGTQFMLGQHTICAWTARILPYNYPLQTSIPWSHTAWASSVPLPHLFPCPLSFYHLKPSQISRRFPKRKIRNNYPKMTKKATHRQSEKPR